VPVTESTRTTVTSGGLSLTPARTLAVAPATGQILLAFANIDTTVDSTITKIELGAAGSGKLFTKLAEFTNGTTLRAYLYGYRVRTDDTGDTAETVVTATQTALRACVLGVSPLNGASTTAFTAEITSAVTGNGTLAQAPALVADTPGGDYCVSVLAATGVTAVANDLAAHGNPTSGWSGSGGTAGGTTPGVAGNLQELIRGVATTTSGEHGAWSLGTARDYITYTVRVAAAPVYDVGAVEFSTPKYDVGAIEYANAPQTLTPSGIVRTTVFGTPGAVQLKGAQKPKPTTHDARTLVTGPLDVSGLYFDNEVTFVGAVTGDQVGFAQPPHFTDGTQTFTNVYLDYAGGAKPAFFISGNTVTTNVTLKYATSSLALSDLGQIDGPLVGNVDIMHVLLRPKAAATGNPAQIASGVTLGQAGATITINSGTVLSVAKTTHAALHAQNSLRGINTDTGGLVEAAVQNAATLLGAVVDGGQAVHRTGSNTPSGAWALQDHALNTTPQTYQYDKATVSGSDQPQRSYTGTSQGRGQWEVMDLVRSKGGQTDRLLIAHGFEMFMHPDYAGPSTHNTLVFANPSFMQRAIDAIFQYAIDAAAFGSPITHVSVGQERKGFSSNFNTTADKTINPDTTTPSGSWWANAAWWHARFFNMLADQRDAHANANVRALKLGFGHFNFGGSSTDENWHGYPLGNEDGSIPPNTSQAKNDEEFVNYLLDWCRDPDFYGLDYSLVDFSATANRTLAYIASHYDRWGVLIRQFKKKLATRAGLSTAKRNAQLFAIEYYYDVNLSTSNTSYTEAQQAWGEMIVLSSLVANGIDKAFKWEPMGDNFPATQFQNLCAWFRNTNTSGSGITDSAAGQATNGAGPGRAYLAYNAPVELKQHFGPGTKLVSWACDDPEVWALVSPAQCLLINLNPTTDKKVTIVYEDRRRQYVTVPHVGTAGNSTNVGWVSVARTPRIGAPKVNRRIRPLGVGRTRLFGAPTLTRPGANAWPTAGPVNPETYVDSLMMGTGRFDYSTIANAYDLAAIDGGLNIGNNPTPGSGGTTKLWRRFQIGTNDVQPSTWLHGPAADGWYFTTGDVVLTGGLKLVGASAASPLKIQLGGHLVIRGYDLGVYPFTKYTDSRSPYVGLQLQDVWLDVGAKGTTPRFVILDTPGNISSASSANKMMRVRPPDTGTFTLTITTTGSIGVTSGTATTGSIAVSSNTTTQLSSILAALNALTIIGAGNATGAYSGIVNGKPEFGILFANDVANIFVTAASQSPAPNGQPDIRYNAPYSGGMGLQISGSKGVNRTTGAPQALLRHFRLTDMLCDGAHGGRIIDNTVCHGTFDAHPDYILTNPDGSPTVSGHGDGWQDLGADNSASKQWAGEYILVRSPRGNSNIYENGGALNPDSTPTVNWRMWRRVMALGHKAATGNKAFAANGAAFIGLHDSLIYDAAVTDASVFDNGSGNSSHPVATPYMNSNVRHMSTFSAVDPTLYPHSPTGSPSVAVTVLTTPPAGMVSLSDPAYG
jgi:hypothetical protein